MIRLMNLKFIIAFLLISLLSFGQDSLHTDSSSAVSKTHVVKGKKKAKKYKKPKKENAVDSTNSINTTQKVRKQTSRGSNNGFYIIAFLVIIALLIIAANRSNLRRRQKTNYDYYKNEYLKSLGWKRNAEENPDLEKLLGHLESLSERQAYYRFEYLKSEAWQRKRYVVLKRDNWTCVHCGARATQVHHKRYARKNIGKEPIEWLESVCKSCHDALHS